MTGASIGTSVGGLGVRLSINIIQIYTHEVSDWGFSDVVVWNRVLPYAEMKKVSDAMLKSVCGGSHYWNSVTNVCTACPVGSLCTGSGFVMCPPNSISDLTKCICQVEGYIWDGHSNSCELSLEFINNKMNNITALINSNVTNIITGIRVEINKQMANITAVMNQQLSNITANINKIHTMNQKLSATLTKLRKTTSRKKKTEL